MQKQVLTPYIGNSPYVFLSYSHQNMDSANEIIRNLQSAGFRVWYDEGIDPGSEWDEAIASYIENSSYFIALLSREYLLSSNCKDELNYARDLEKPRLLVYLEDISLPSGMRMRLSRLQAIHKYRYDEQDKFYEKLFASQGIQICMELPPAKSDVAENAIPNSMVTSASFRLIFIIDTSGSMHGARLMAINNALKAVRESLIRKYSSELYLDILQFGTQSSWRTFDDLPLEADGLTNMGQALQALRERGNRISPSCPCVLVFVSDGLPTDRYEDTLHLLQQETWFTTAVKVGIAIGNESDEMLASIVGSSCAVLAVDSIRSIQERLEEITIASVMAARKNGEQRTSITGRNIIDWLGNENIDEQLNWQIDDNGTLKIISGAIIPDYYLPHPQTPWAPYRDSIRRIVLMQGIRIIGMHAFNDLPELEEVVIPESITDIRFGAFGQCEKLKIVQVSRDPIRISDFREKERAPKKSLILWPEAFPKQIQYVVRPR